MNYSLAKNIVGVDDDERCEVDEEYEDSRVDHIHQQVGEGEDTEKT